MGADREDASGDVVLWQRWQSEIEFFESLLPTPIGPAFAYLRKRLTRLSGDVSRSGIEPDALVARMTENEAFADLMMRAIPAAARTRHEVKRRAFARAIANGYLAADDAEIDRAVLIVQLVDRLEMPHIRGIELLLVDEDRPAIHVLSDGLGDAAPLVLSTLAAERLMNEQTNFDGGPDFRGVSPLGEELLRYLVDAELAE